MSNLPPGVTSAMIDRAYGWDGPCNVCSQWEEGCICPECPTCGAIGDPACYDGAVACDWAGLHPLDGPRLATDDCLGHASHRRVPLHGLIRSFAQVVLRAELDRRMTEEAVTESEFYRRQVPLEEAKHDRWLQANGNLRNDRDDVD